MKYYTFEIVVEKEAEDDGYLAYSPALPGCLSNGKTIEDAKRTIREVIQQHLQLLLAQGAVYPSKREAGPCRRTDGCAALMGRMSPVWAQDLRQGRER